MNQMPIGPPILTQEHACAIIEWAKGTNDFEEEYEEKRNPDLPNDLN